MKTKDIIIDNKLFLLLWGAAIVFGIGLILAYDKPEIVLAVNSNNHWLTDVLFKYLTYLGEAPIVVLTIVVSFFCPSLLQASILQVSISFQVRGNSKTEGL